MVKLHTRRGRRVLSLHPQHVGGGRAPGVVEAPHLLAAGVGDLAARLGDLERRPPRPIGSQGYQLVDAVESRVPLRRDESGSHSVDQPPDEPLRIDAILRSLLLDLGDDLPDGQLVQVAGEDDGGVGKPGLVQQAGRLNAEVGQVAGVEADAHRFVTTPPQLLEHGHRVGDPALEGVDGVDQQQALVGVQLGVGAEGSQLALAGGHEDLDHAVGMCALRGDVQHVGDADVGGEVGTTDQRRSGARVGSLLRAAPHPELQHRPLPPALVDPGGLGGDEGLVVEVVEQRRLQHLCHRQRAPHHGERHVGMHHPPLGDRVHADRLEAAVTPQPVKEVVAEDPIAATPGLPPQIVDVLVTEVRLAHPVEQPFQTRVHAVARLVPSVVGVAAEEVVELHRDLVEALAEVELGHGQLVEVGEEDALRSRSLVGLHGRAALLRHGALDRSRRHRARWDHPLLLSGSGRPPRRRPTTLPPSTPRAPGGGGHTGHGAVAETGPDHDRHVMAGQASVKRRQPAGKPARSAPRSGNPSCRIAKIRLRAALVKGCPLCYSIGWGRPWVRLRGSRVSADGESTPIWPAGTRLDVLAFIGSARLRIPRPAAPAEEVRPIS